MPLRHIATKDGGEQINLLLISKEFVTPLHGLVTRLFLRLFLPLCHERLQLLVHLVFLKVAIVNSETTFLGLVDCLFQSEDDLLQMAVAHWSQSTPPLRTAVTRIRHVPRFTRFHLFEHLSPHLTDGGVATIHIETGSNQLLDPQLKITFPHLIEQTLDHASTQVARACRRL